MAAREVATMRYCCMCCCMYNVVQHHRVRSCCKLTQWCQKFCMMFDMGNNMETEIKFSFMVSSVAVQLAHVYLKIQADKQRCNFRVVCILPWVQLLLSCLLSVFNYFYNKLFLFSCLGLTASSDNWALFFFEEWRLFTCHVREGRSCFYQCTCFLTLLLAMTYVLNMLLWCEIWWTWV